MDRAHLAEWIDGCSKTYVQNPATGKFSPSTEIGAIPGWDVKDTFSIDGWDATRLPVCNIYQGRNADGKFTTIPVTPAAYDKRLIQLQTFISNNLPADIIAFQEVSGEEAVREALPNNGADYEVCSFTDFKVQRLAIAWKKSLGMQVDCLTEKPMSLPGNSFDKQPRPGLSVTLQIGDQQLRILTVHLKSSCVSPLEGNKLGSTADACTILQQQVVPVENWLEAKTAGGVKTVLLGDFNRNLWHELRDGAAVRSDGSDPTRALTAGAKANSLIEEVNDGVPASSYMTMLTENCPVNAVAELICRQGETRKLEQAEDDLLGFKTYLGCRNSTGLDHILVTSGLTAQGEATHVSIKQFGGSFHKSSTNPEPLLAIADHCPLMAKLTF